MATPLEPKLIRIYLSSPDDVRNERDIAQQVIEQLQRDKEFYEHFQLILYRWDDPTVKLPMEAGETPQKSANVYMIRPSECDLVVVLFWSRMGTKAIVDGREYLSGTHYELCDAQESQRVNGKPGIWLYHCTRVPEIQLSDPQRDEKIRQYDLIQQFFADFQDDEGHLKGGITEFLQLEDFRSEFAGQLRTYLRVLRDRPERLREMWVNELEIGLDMPPYKGLPPLDENDAQIFFGRERERLEVLALMKRERFVIIVGASGSGKSSLAAAGVLPRLRARRNWRIARAKPGTDPFQNLGNGLVEGIPELRSQSIEAIRNVLRAGGQNLEALLSNVLPNGTHVLLYIDQLEELFTLAEKAQGADDLRAFAALLRYASPKISLLATMRADFYETALAYFEQELRRGGYSLGKPSPFALREMIERPAERAKLELNDDLAELIVAEVNDQPGALPLMAYLLTQMYEQMEKRRDRRMTQADYDLVGGVSGAISKCADAAYDDIELSAERNEAALNRVFRELIELTDEQGKLVPTRRRGAPEVLMSTPDAAMLVNRLTAARLLTADRQVIEVAHEALFTSWKMLADWIQRVQDDLRLFRQFERDARDWERRGRPHEGQPRNETLRPFLKAIDHLQIQVIDPILVAYTDLYPKKLLEEVEVIDTPHQRRLFIGERLALLGDPRKGVGVKELRWGDRIAIIPDIEWCFVEAQKDERGRWPRIKAGWRSPEIRPYWIARYMITVRQFQAFLDDPEGYENLDWWQHTPVQFRQPKAHSCKQLGNEPRTYVMWYQAMAFSRWLNARYRGEVLVGQEAADATWVIGDKVQIRLPTEWEWQWAAQGGSEEREYPWGAGTAARQTRSKLVLVGRLRWECTRLAQQRVGHWIWRAMYGNGA
ncbi:MAG: SUMF1/EgtB/PvdO family nonheme iron enzyme [Anaerolineae bacterium]|nr:SUMF1/EgtB/PvdO family nonheme iron enzyme [Anaerolineae bacterium]